MILLLAMVSSSMCRDMKSQEKCQSAKLAAGKKKDDSILCLTKHVKDIIKYLQMLSHSDCLIGQTSETL